VKTTATLPGDDDGATTATASQDNDDGATTATASHDNDDGATTATASQGNDDGDARWRWHSSHFCEARN
jgi:hypothetical protein